MLPFVLLMFFVFFEKIRFVLRNIRLPLDNLYIVETHAIFTKHLKDILQLRGLEQLTAATLVHTPYVEICVLVTSGLSHMR